MSVSNILIDMQNNTAKVQAEAAESRRGQSTIDQDAFLQLLMTQLRNQDPLNPMDNTEFISQTAQFTQISELQKLNNTSSIAAQIAQATSFVGKEVTVQDPDDSDKTIVGKVKEAKFNSEGASIVINDKVYPIGLVMKVAEETPSTSTN